MRRPSLDDHPEIKQEELVILLREEGIGEQDARSAAERIARSPHSLIKTKVEKELRLAYGEHETALGDALIVGQAYALAALIPLWPYFAWDVRTALPISLAATAVALFMLALAKARWLDWRWCAAAFRCC
jgi:VIT1/CCC1 family predicted Fe2+/Mn2+ transporter